MPESPQPPLALTPQSPLAILLMQKLSTLNDRHIVRLTNDWYDPTLFGGATALQAFVDDVRLELNTRDPGEPTEIELGPEQDIFWNWRASHVKYFLEKTDNIELPPTALLLDWLVENWDAVHRLIFEAPPEEQAAFKAVSHVLVKKLHATQREFFRRLPGK